MRAAGPGDGPAVLALVERIFDGGEDPRLIAGIAALWRIVSPTPAEHTGHGQLSAAPGA